MSFIKNRRTLGISVFTAVSFFAQTITGQSSREADGARLLRGAIDMHFHMDAPTPKGSGEHADIAKVRVAQSRGLRALVIKNHFEPTATLAYHLRPEVPNLELFGGIVMNRTNGGMNPAACAARGLTGFRMVDCMFGALAQMLPDKVFASSDGGNTGISIGGWDADRRPFIMSISPAAPGADGPMPTVSTAIPTSRPTWPRNRSR